jgi:hypothetical protein
MFEKYKPSTDGSPWGTGFGSEDSASTSSSSSGNSVASTGNMFATRLKRGKLVEQFPQIHPTIIDDVFMETGYFFFHFCIAAAFAMSKSFISHSSI